MVGQSTNSRQRVAPPVRPLSRPCRALGACLVVGRYGLFVVAFLGGAGCSQSRKLSEGGPVDTLMYGVLGHERDPRYYYEKLRDSHDAESDAFRYRVTDDPYLVDKSVDATERLGRARYSRLEGQAQVAILLSNVLLEDPVPLARTNAASSLTRMGVRLPRYGRPAWARDQEERGDRFLAWLRNLDAMHAPDGRLLAPTPEEARRRIELVRAMGDVEIADLEIARDAVKPFTTRRFLIDAAEPELRAAVDTALVKRIEDLIKLSLQAALDAPYDHVRREAVMGLKLMAVARAEDAVLGRLTVEFDPHVRGEIVEYLGKLGSEDAIEALVGLLQDGDPSIRHRARRALVRIAGRDFGRDHGPWVSWAHAMHPELAVRAAEAERLRRRAGGDPADPDGADPSEQPTDEELEEDAEEEFVEGLPPAEDVLPSAG